MGQAGHCCVPVSIYSLLSRPSCCLQTTMPGMKRDCGGAAAILGAFRAAVKQVSGIPLLQSFLRSPHPSQAKGSNRGRSEGSGAALPARDGDLCQRVRLGDAVLLSPKLQCRTGKKCMFNKGVVCLTLGMTYFLKGAAQAASRRPSPSCHQMQGLLSP